MTHTRPSADQVRISDQTSEVNDADARAPTNFFAGMFASLNRAGLGRFFGVAPAMSKGRSDSLNRQVPTDDGDNAETRQAKEIYQSMLDITGH